MYASVECVCVLCSVLCCVCACVCALFVVGLSLVGGYFLVSSLGRWQCSAGATMKCFSVGHVSLAGQRVSCMTHPAASFFPVNCKAYSTWRMNGRSASVVQWRCMDNDRALGMYCRLVDSTSSFSYTGITGRVAGTTQLSRKNMSE